MSDKFLHEGSVGWPCQSMDQLIAFLEGLRSHLTEEEKRLVEVDMYYTNNDDGVHLDVTIPERNDITKPKG